MTPNRNGDFREAGDRRCAASEFASRLTAAMSTRGISLTGLRDRLASEGHRVALSTLSYWRKGERRPEHPASLEAVAEIESVLGLAPGHLLNALPPSRRPGPTPPVAKFTQLADLDPTESRAVLDDFGLDEVHRAVLPVSLHVTIDVDEHRNDWCATTRVRLRAAVDGVRVYPVGLAGVAAGEQARLQWVRGAIVARSVVVPDIGVNAWELAFERPLRLNETTVLEYAITLPLTPHDHFEYFVQRRVQELMLWVRFTAPAIPEHVEIYDTSSGEEEQFPVDLTGLSTALFSAHSYGPGRAGIRWRW